MFVAFILSMPGRNTWNGKWSGDDLLQAIVKEFDDNDKMPFALQPYEYDFKDGWRARIDVRVVDPVEAAELERKSKGFWGYDWMVDSIIHHGDIYGPEKEK